MQQYTTPAILCGGLNLLRCFPDRTIPNILVTTTPTDLALTSRLAHQQKVITDYRTTPEKAIAELLALADSLSEKPVLYYGDDKLLLLISAHRDELAKRFRFLMPPAEHVETFVDKARFDRLARSLDLPVPQTLLSRDINRWQDITDHLSLPCLLKPNSHIGWHHSEIVRRETGGQPQKGLVAHTESDLVRLYDVIRTVTSDFVVQEFIPGGEDQIYSFHAFYDSASQPLAYYVGKKIRTYPRMGGESCYLELVHEPEVVRLGMDILKRLSFVGPVKLDFKKDVARKTFTLLEINARYNLWHYLGSVCGINLPQIAYRHLCGENGKPQTLYQTGVRWLAFGMDFRSFIKSYRPSGELGWGGYLLSLRGPKIFNIFAWNDPVPFFISQWRYLTTVAARALRTT